MPVPRKLTDAQIAYICDRRERGWSHDRLAAELGVTPASVHYHCLRQGAVSPRQRRHTTPRRPERLTLRDGRQLRRFSPEEDERMLTLEAQGLTRTEIARRLGRARTSVVMRLMTLAMRDDLPATGAAE